MLAIVLTAAACAGFVPPENRGEPAVDLTKLSLSKLDERLNNAHNLGYFSDRRLRTDHFEAVLQQIIKRGGPEAEALISNRLKQRPLQLDAAQQLGEQLEQSGNRDAWIQQNTVVHHLRNNLELLTALRRIQKKPDPVQIEVLLAIDVQELPILFHSAALVQAVENGLAKSSKRIEEELQKASNDLDDAHGRLKKIDRQEAPSAWNKQNAIAKRLQESVDTLRWKVDSTRDIERLVPHTTKMNPGVGVRAQAAQAADIRRCS